MGESTVITRDGKTGALRIQRSSMWTPVDRAGGFVAGDHGLAGWTFDVALAFSTSVPSQGVMSTARVNLGPRMVYRLSTVWLSISQGGQGLSDCFVGVYTVSEDTAQLASASGDVSALFQSGGDISVTIDPASINGGQDVWILVGVLVGTGSQMPTIRGALAQPTVNLNVQGTAGRYGTVGSGLSNLPQSFSSDDMNGIDCTFWTGVG